MKFEQLRCNTTLGINLVRKLFVEGRVLVIGAGVSGLTTSLCLLRHGFKVTVVAEFAPAISSVVACALWQWPLPALL